jgi:hypothetical protein
MPTTAYCPEVSSQRAAVPRRKSGSVSRLDKIGFTAPSTGSVTSGRFRQPLAFTNCNQPVGGKIWFSHTTTRCAG